MLKIVKKSTLQALHSDVNSKQKTIDALRNVADKQEASYERLSSKSKACSAINESLRAEIRELRNLIGSKNEEISNINSGNSKLKNQNTSLRSEIEVLKSQLEEAQDEVKTLSDRVKSQLSIFRSKDATIGILNSDIDKLKESNSELEEANKILEAQKKQNYDAVLGLTSQINSFKTLESNYDNLYDGVQSAIKALKNHRGKLPDGANKALKALTGIVPSSEPCETDKMVVVKSGQPGPSCVPNDYADLSENEGPKEATPEPVDYEAVSKPAKRKYTRRK